MYISVVSRKSNTEKKNLNPFLAFNDELTIFPALAIKKRRLDSSTIEPILVSMEYVI